MKAVASLKHELTAIFSHAFEEDYIVAAVRGTPSPQAVFSGKKIFLAAISMHMAMNNIRKEKLPPRWLTTVENALSKVLAPKYPHCAELNDAFFSFLYYHGLSACSLQQPFKLAGECLKLVGSNKESSAFGGPAQPAETRVLHMARAYGQAEPTRRHPPPLPAADGPPPSGLEYLPSMNYRGILVQHALKEGNSPPSYETVEVDPPYGEPGQGRNWFKAKLTVTIGGKQVVMENEAKSKKEAMSLVSFDVVTRYLARTDMAHWDVPKSGEPERNSGK
ncbi:hypothetical protein J8273_3937 [Carpediemonas membranifera]|uniref:DRBM domain-containing protein n=1 Tax=Carpediemonas membranifera TaxID=201153 RepID=A0A8J6AU77_9EUKA|nr:hypothetical protein J8273_3937 [Carpediemonas membranifera]|eukprot:KAG9394303.1 hypothetical protein J8273_3937 [Carpediemonas membranifera]